MSGIVLSASVRQNLLSLQSTADMLGTVQNKLATGRKVNSALDNAKSYFTAQGLTNRASDLSNLLDDMGQSIQVLKSADQGITSISKLIDSAKGKANQALSTTSTDTATRAKYANEYGELLAQIQTVAKDSGYNGKNLLAGTGNDLSVIFNEDSTSKLLVSAVDYTTVNNLSLSTTLNSLSGAAYAASTTEGSLAGASAGDYLKFDVDTAGGSVSYKIDLSATDTIKDVVQKVNQQTNGDVQASFDETTRKITYSSASTFVADRYDSSDAAQTDTNLGGTSSSATVSFSTDAQINSVLKALSASLNTLRAQASTFGTALSTVQIRQDWTKNIVNTLSTGSDKLTLADSNEEGANLLALQTQQSLSSKALSLSAQAGQQVLQLLG